MSHEHAHDAFDPTEGEYTDADHGDGTTAGHHAVHSDEVEGEYTDGVYSADGREVHLPHHGEGAYTDADHADADHADADHADADHADGHHPDAPRLGTARADAAPGAGVAEEEGEYTDGRYPDDGDAGHADIRRS